jgi:uncharacterized MnhB-related membrane protein
MATRAIMADRDLEAVVQFSCLGLALTFAYLNVPGADAILYAALLN